MPKETTAPVVDDIIDSAPDEVKKSELDELKEQVENSKKEVESQRLRAEAAERDREEVAKKLTIESTERVRYQGSSIENMIAAKQAEAERLKRACKEAHENGRFDEYAELVADYGIAKQEVKNSENYKAQLEAQEEARTQAVENDPLARYTPRERQWINEHPQFLSDERFQKKVTAAHHLAESEGIRPNTDEYFDYVNNFLEPKQDSEPPPRKTSTSLPPSRSGSSGTTSGQSKTIRLTPEQVEIAILTNPKMSPADAQKAYYDNLLTLKTEGRIN